MQFYCDPSREETPHALPDAETFHVRANEALNTELSPIESCSRCGCVPAGLAAAIGVCPDCDWLSDDEATKTLTKSNDSNKLFLEPGWYWQAVFPGNLPDGPPFGSFESEDLAIADARESVGAA